MRDRIGEKIGWTAGLIWWIMNASIDIGITKCHNNSMI